MLRINYGKKLVKDILKSYAFFILKKNIIEELDESEYIYLEELFADLQSDIFLESNNTKNLEKLAEKSGTKILSNTAALEDYYIFIGFNLFNIHFMQKHQESLVEEVEGFHENVEIYNRQLAHTVHALREYVLTLTDDKVINFHKRLADTLGYLEKECAIKMKEHMEKITGDDVTMLSPRFGVL